MIVDEYASPENDYAFSKTVVPVRLSPSSRALLAFLESAVLWPRWRRLKQESIIIVNLLLDGFEGKLTTEKCAKLRESPHHTALRHIQDLIGEGILKQEKGGGRSEQPTPLMHASG